MAITKELREAVEAMQAGKEEGFAYVYEQTHDYVYAKARYMMHTEQDALDLTQETYIQAYKGIASLRDADHVYAWLGGIVYRQGLKIFHKGEGEFLAGEEQDYLFEEIESTEITPEQSLEESETARIIQGMIDELPELQKVAVMAFYYDNMKIDEIAQMCDCSSNTIKSRLNYAKKFLKTKVEEHEKQNQYKLRALSPALLFLVYKELFAREEFKMPVHEVQRVYEAASSACNLSKGTASGVGSTAVVTKTGMSAAMKVVIGIVAAGVIVGGAAAAVHFIGDEEETIGLAEDGEELEDKKSDKEKPDADNSDMEGADTEEELQDEEEVYDDSIPLEGKYVYGDYEISITHANVTDAKTATFDLKLKNRATQNGKAETVVITNAQKTEGVVQIDAKSDADNQWSGELRFMADGSIRMNVSVREGSTGEVYDLGGEGLPILTKAMADGTIQEKAPVEATYSYTEGTDTEFDSGDTYTVTIREVSEDAEGISFKMILELASNGGTKVDILQTDMEYIYMKDGIATFSGTTGWEAMLYGYLYVKDDNTLVLSYSSLGDTEAINWFGAYPSDTNQPLELKKID